MSEWASYEVTHGAGGSWVVTYQWERASRYLSAAFVIPIGTPQAFIEQLVKEKVTGQRKPVMSGEVSLA